MLPLGFVWVGLIFIFADLSDFALTLHSLSPMACTPSCSCGSPEPTPPPSSLFRRRLPSSLIPFSSDTGRRMFAESLQCGHLESYFALAEQFVTQQEPAYCALSTLAMALNALSIDPLRVWRHPWRWFHEEMLDCCVPLEDVRREGITLNEFVCLAKCNGADAKLVNGDDGDIDAFRDDVLRCVSQSGAPDEVLVASFSRRTLGQTGDGHFSPIAGYHSGTDSVLVLDVARFKYPPYWVSLSLLLDSLLPSDAATGRPRGYIVLTRASTDESGVALSAHLRSWAPTISSLRSHLASCGSLGEWLDALADGVPVSCGNEASDCTAELEQTEAFSRVNVHVSHPRDVTFFILAMPDGLLATLVPGRIAGDVDALRRGVWGSALSACVGRVRTQMDALVTWC